MQIRIGHSWNSLDPKKINPIFRDYSLIGKYCDFLIYRQVGFYDTFAGNFVASKSTDCESYSYAFFQADSLRELKEKILNLQCLVV